MISDVENKDMCSICGGRCCKNFGCMYMPSDFDSMEYESLKKTIKTTNNISIGGQIMKTEKVDDWTFFLYLHARNEGANIVDLISKGGPCSALGPNGCTIEDRSKRPSGGVSVIPMGYGEGCISTISDEESAEAWIPYQEMLKKLVEYFDSDIINVLNRQVEDFLDFIQLEQREEKEISGAQADILRKIFYAGTRDYVDVCEFLKRTESLRKRRQ